MIDLTPQLTLAQIAFALVIIAATLVYYIFGRKSSRPKH